jgi:hypothetical protein
LSITLASLVGLGDVTVFSVGAGDDVADEAARLQVPVVPVPWVHDYGKLLTVVAQHLGDGPWFIAYADETVVNPGGCHEQDINGLVAAGVRHRTGERDSYQEENECRATGVGCSPPIFRGLVYARALQHNVPVDPDDLPHSGVVFEHYPARWVGLAPQRLARTAQVYRTALDDRPCDPELLYGLFHCRYSAHEWGELRGLAARWRDSASADDSNRPLVDYYEACAAVAQKNTVDAFRLVENAVRSWPTFADGWYLMGELHAAAGRLGDADDAFANAAKIGRGARPVAVEDYSLATWRPWQARAVLAKRIGRRRQAEEFLVRARQIRRELQVG